jgi:hypothetical protein
MQPGRVLQATEPQTDNRNRHKSLSIKFKIGGLNMAYIRKTVDRWDIMGNYGYGWECECSEYTWKEAKQTLKEYRKNGGGCYRLEKHREKKEV